MGWNAKNKVPNACMQARTITARSSEAKPTRGVCWILTGGDVAGVLTLGPIENSVVVPLFPGSHLLFLPGSEACIPGSWSSVTVLRDNYLIRISGHALSQALHGKDL